MPDRYVATIVDVPGGGIRLDPADVSAVPEKLDEIHLLVLAVAFALGRAGYDHHPEPRDPAMQTLEGVLNGESVLPWRAPSGTDHATIVCDLGGMPHCRVVPEA
ncbi:hypothetical protein ACFQS1_33810 [Paractinoplanes rhizophilus]|jgi:hypothetical protein|uniref:Uncharacterized protein n=1 Tax=Paractinoplanes rhizophilus TaxID=1416877 RepID=A0ABW2I256_9ACTN|nr:hypothetical protein [Actinoplanes sp.]